MSFIFYDLIFLALFVIFVFIFLRSKRKNLKKDGLLILYRTKWGINLINAIGKKFPKTLRFLSYISIGIGYILMVGIIYLIGRVVYVYGTRPDIVQAIKVPPLLPILPYVTEIPSLSFLPPFYFTYWIIIIAIVAITHEMSHGIFMRRYNIKIKSTGFGFFPNFLPIFLAAFVEQDEKSMNKSKKFEQLSVLSAGTFANVITGVLFFAIMLLFFSLAFNPSGVVFDSYPYTYVNTSDIISVNGINVQSPSYDSVLVLLNDSGLNNIKAGSQNFVITKNALSAQKEIQGLIALYYDSPAINANLENTIFKIDGVPVKSIEDVQASLEKHSPGDVITLNVLNKDGDDYDVDVALGKNPKNNSLPWLGISFSASQNSGAISKVSNWINFKDPHVHYNSKLGDLGLFLYNLLWWIILISLSVALVNMLPVGMFDGGRFFYLTVLGITKNEKFAKNAFAFSTYFVLILFLMLMLFWAFSFA